MVFIAKEYRILNFISTTKFVIKITTQYISKTMAAKWTNSLFT